MKFTQIPQDTFKKLVLNAGVLLSAFNPATAEYDNDDIIGATSDDVTFVATPSYSDFGADINNCPKNVQYYRHSKENIAGLAQNGGFTP